MVDSEDKSMLPWIISFVIGFVIVFLLFFKPEYEGRTAREWFDQYDWVVACIETSNNPKVDCI